MKAGNTFRGTERPLTQACEGFFEGISLVVQVLVKTCEGISGGVLHETSALLHENGGFGPNSDCS